MSKIIIMSDTHDLYNFNEVLAYEQADYAIHAGDSELPFSSKEMQPFNFKVRGNCDFDPSYSLEISVTIPKIGKLLILHGHNLKQDVKISKNALYDTINKHKANLVVYGHTHIINIEYKNNVDCLIINPGSPALPKSEKFDETYIILEYSATNYIIYIKDANTYQTLNKIKLTRLI